MCPSPLSLHPGAPTVPASERCFDPWFFDGPQCAIPSLMPLLPPRHGLCWKVEVTQAFLWVILLKPLSCSRHVWARTASLPALLSDVGHGSAGPQRPKLLTAGAQGHPNVEPGQTQSRQDTDHWVRWWASGNRTELHSIFGRRPVSLQVCVRDCLLCKAFMFTHFSLSI